MSAGKHFNFPGASESPEGLDKTWIAGLTSEFLIHRYGLGPEKLIFNKFPEAAGLGTTLWELFATQSFPGTFCPADGQIQALWGLFVQVSWISVYSRYPIYVV